MGKINKTSTLKVSVGLDRQKLPVRLRFQTSDDPKDQLPRDVKAMLLSLFDRDSLETLKIDLWTEDMQINEMDRFFYQTLRALADTYFRATQNKELTVEMQKFVHYFGQETGIVPKS